jgi:hypothetical protein
MTTRTKAPSTKEKSKAVRARPFIFWLTAAAAGAAALTLLASWRGDRRRAALAEFRLGLTRKRLRTARAELREADEYLAATGELLDCYMEEFGPLPVNPFAPAEAFAGEEWPEELMETTRRED